MYLVKAAAVVTVLMTVSAAANFAAAAETSASVVDFETPLSRLQPCLLQHRCWYNPSGSIRRPGSVRAG